MDPRYALISRIFLWRQNLSWIEKLEEIHKECIWWMNGLFEIMRKLIENINLWNYKAHFSDGYLRAKMFDMRLSKRELHSQSSSILQEKIFQEFYAIFVKSICQIIHANKEFVFLFLFFFFQIYTIPHSRDVKIGGKIYNGWGWGKKEGFFAY